MVETQKVGGIWCHKVRCLNFGKLLSELSAVLAKEKHITFTKDGQVKIAEDTALIFDVVGLKLEHGILVVRNNECLVNPSAVVAKQSEYGLALHHRSDRIDVYIPIQTPPSAREFYKNMVDDELLEEFPIALTETELSKALCQDTLRFINMDVIKEQLSNVNTILDAVTNVVLSGTVIFCGIQYYYSLFIEPEIRYTQYNGSAYALHYTNIAYALQHNTTATPIPLYELPIVISCKIRDLAERDSITVPGADID